MVVLAPNRVQSLDKGVALLDRIVRDGGTKSLNEQATELGLPSSTAYRLVSSYVQMGWISQMDRGCYGPSLGFHDLATGMNRAQILTGVARTPVRHLARRLGKTVHFGILEDDMVTYLLKEGQNVSAGFTRAGMQLEAYCSGIGKVLLAHLPEKDRELYLASGPFVALTRHTVIDPDILRSMLETVRAQDMALDVREVSENLWCIAVPVRDRQGQVVAAMSVSRMAEEDKAPLDPRLLAALRDCADQISRKL